MITRYSKFTSSMQNTFATFQQFGTFILTQVANLEWLRLSSINSFLLVYAFLMGIISILVTCGFLSLSSHITNRLLPPWLLVDPLLFNAPRFSGQKVPGEIARVIQNNANELVLLPTRKTVFPREPRPTGFMVFDAKTGLLLNGGMSDDIIIPIGNTLFVKRYLGLAALTDHSIAHLTDEQLSAWLPMLQFFSFIPIPLGKHLRIEGDMPLSALEPILDRERSQNTYTSWIKLAIASNVVSFVLIENDSDLPASNVHITIRIAGKVYGVEPLVLYTTNQSPFKYDHMTNSIDVSRIAAREQLIILTLSKSALHHDDIVVSWDKFSEFDVFKVCKWFFVILGISFFIVIISMFPEFKKREQ